MIVGITGLIGSGKDTVANYLVTQHDFKRLSFASSVKDMLTAVFGWDRELLEGLTPESRKWRETVDEWWANRLNMPDFTPRFALQYWGTDLCRNKFHTDIWVASLENKLRNTANNTVITDCRFLNEITAIKNAGGAVIRVHRGCTPDWYEAAISFNKGPDQNLTWSLSKDILEKAKIHASEYSSVGLAYDYEFTNDGSLEDLYQHLSGMMRDMLKNDRLLDRPVSS